MTIPVSLVTLSIPLIENRLNLKEAFIFPKIGSSTTVVGELNFESSNHLVIRAFLVCMRKT